MTSGVRKLQVSLKGRARVCRVCGCRDSNCSQCISDVAAPCFWVAPDLCSSCAQVSIFPGEQWATCVGCSLHSGQAPLIHRVAAADVMWVGISAKKVLDMANSIPIGPETATGEILSRIETGIQGVSFCRTNLVKCPPLDANGKLRYPSPLEMKACVQNLTLEIEQSHPRVVYLLGGIVSGFLKKRYRLNNRIEKGCLESAIFRGTTFIMAAHPSYIRIYRRHDLPAYIANIQASITSRLA